MKKLILLLILSTMPFDSFAAPVEASSVGRVLLASEFVHELANRGGLRINAATLPLSIRLRLLQLERERRRRNNNPSGGDDDNGNGN